MLLAKGCVKRNCDAYVVDVALMAGVVVVHEYEDYVGV